MKIIEEDYKKARSPLCSSSKVSLCEEETIVYDERTKKEVKFNKLFLLCNSTGIIFSDNEIHEENIRRINDVIKTRSKNKRKKNEKPTINRRPSE